MSPDYLCKMIRHNEVCLLLNDVAFLANIYDLKLGNIKRDTGGGEDALRAYFEGVLQLPLVVVDLTAKFIKV